MAFLGQKTSIIRWWIAYLNIYNCPPRFHIAAKHFFLKSLSPMPYQLLFQTCKCLSPQFFFLKSKPENPGVKLNTKLCLLAEYQWGIYTFTHTHTENTSFHMLGFFPSVNTRQGSSSLKPGAWYSILASHGCSRNPNIWAMGISRKLGALTQCATIATPSGDSWNVLLVGHLPLTVSFPHSSF